jgi:hypothetical protein
VQSRRGQSGASGMCCVGTLGQDRPRDRLERVLATKSSHDYSERGGRYGAVSSVRGRWPTDPGEKKRPLGARRLAQPSGKQELRIVSVNEFLRRGSSKNKGGWSHNENHQPQTTAD